MKAKFVLSKSKVKRQVIRTGQMADIVSYSLKTNYEVGKVLEEISDCLFSIHSIEALKLLKDKKRGLFFLQCHNKKEIEEILKQGTSSFVIDNEKDLGTLLKTIQKPITLFLRMKLKENTIHTGKHFVFGLRTRRVNELIPGLKQNKKIKQLGIHFHRKTQNVSEWNLKEELEASMEKQSLKDIGIVNIGGGLPSIYKNYTGKVLTSILKNIKEVRRYLNSNNIKMMIEPGRYIAAPSVKLMAEIKNTYGNNIIINCSIYNSAMDTFIANIRLLVEGEGEKGTAYTIKGCTPDSLDIFRYKVYLKNPKTGDKVIFLNAGAYNFSTDFCQLERLETEIIP